MVGGEGRRGGCAGRGVGAQLAEQPRFDPLHGRVPVPQAGYDRVDHCSRRSSRRSWLERRRTRGQPGLAHGRVVQRRA